MNIISQFPHLMMYHILNIIKGYTIQHTSPIIIEEVPPVSAPNAYGQWCCLFRVYPMETY